MDFAVLAFIVIFGLTVASLQSSLRTFIRNRFLQNVIFWVGYAVIPFLTNLGSFGSPANMYTDIQYYLECAALGYFNNLILMPRLVDHKKYWTYALTILLVISGFTAVSSQITSIISPNYGQSLVGHLYAGIDFLIFTVAFGSSHLLRSYIRQSERINKLEEEKLQTEIDFLKSQINPHLLFNTLNAIYSLSLEQSKATPGLILKLSDMMRYMLYETNEPKVSLDKEVKYLQNYVSLQQVRIEERGVVNFEVSGDLINHQIVPMLLIVFIENAFKHSMDSLSSDIRIDIDLNVHSNRLELTVENNHDESGNGTTPGGVGLKNAQKRLELLYADQHNLETRILKNTYKVKLHLDL